MQDLTLLSHSLFLISSFCVSVSSALYVCTNPLLWSLGALNWKHIVSGATDDAWCFMSASPRWVVSHSHWVSGAGSKNHQSLLPPLHEFQFALVFQYFEILFEILWGEMRKSLITNHLISLQYNCHLDFRAILIALQHKHCSMAQNRIHFCIAGAVVWVYPPSCSSY